MKRKRATEGDPGARVKGKILHAIKEVRQSTKKAKTFDTQKLVKKLKGVRQKNDGDPVISDLEAQLIALKSLDIESLANQALKTKLLKDRFLANNEHIQRAMSSYLSGKTLASPTSSTPAAAKVQSRLLSSKVLASEVMRAVEYLRKVLEAPMKEDEYDAEDLASNEDSSDDDEDEDKDAKAHVLKPVARTRAKGAKAPRAPEEMEDDDDNEEKGESGEKDHVSWESGSVDDRSAAEAGWESGTVNGSDGGESDSDASENDRDSIADSDAGFATSLPNKKSRAAPIESTFLPSLAVGFTRGDSDSEFSDSEAKVADGIRKNRRGQRARRAIWEKKFGRNATHVKKQREITNLKGFSRTPGRSQPRPLGRTDAREPWRGSAREGFQSSVPRRQAAAFPHGQTSVNNSAAGARHAPDHRPAAISTVPPKPREERPLHPSWEAKKRQKEKQHAAILPSAGKKIKF